MAEFYCYFKLLKPGKLTEEEQAIMETHVRIGYELVCRIAFLAGSAEIVLTHHERYDGTGYPQGLRGERNRWDPPSN